MSELSVELRDAMERGVAYGRAERDAEIRAKREELRAYLAQTIHTADEAADAILRLLGVQS